MIRRLLDLPARSVHCVTGAGPAVFYVADTEAGGVLVNTPAYSPALLHELSRLAPPRFAFYPSRLGARDMAAWRTRMIIPMKTACWAPWACGT